MGDWIILKEDFIRKNIGMEYFQKDFKNKYYRPKKIIEITYTFEKDKPRQKQIIIDIEGINTIIKWSNFRVATESEIRKEKIKSIFIKS
jgi:hypothetical protein